jgi:hypothetical protein
VSVYALAHFCFCTLGHLLLKGELVLVSLMWWSVCRQPYSCCTITTGFTEN